MFAAVLSEYIWTNPTGLPGPLITYRSNKRLRGSTPSPSFSKVAELRGATWSLRDDQNIGVTDCCTLALENTEPFVWCWQDIAFQFEKDSFPSDKWLNENAQNSKLNHLLKESFNFKLTVQFLSRIAKHHWFLVVQSLWRIREPTLGASVMDSTYSPAFVIAPS